MQPELWAVMVRDAAARIKPLARHTPVFSSTSIDRASGVEVHFKCENLQRGGAFKIRGASNLILSIPDEDLKRGVVAFSSGNHAQAVAMAAKHVGTKATIVMPEDAPRGKLEATRNHGATIITYDRHRESREAIAAQILKETGATLVPPFDHPLVMAGQGRAAPALPGGGPPPPPNIPPIRRRRAPLPRAHPFPAPPPPIYPLVSPTVHPHN